MKTVNSKEKIREKWERVGVVGKDENKEQSWERKGPQG
jgi:hypothetical protein